ncbi:hypothetical protein GV789_29165, partial [Nocardia cyriacigeorgica]|nr:hypothetical protein [Nocardia cyriacigeorgica]
MPGTISAGVVHGTISRLPSPGPIAASKPGSWLIRTLTPADRAILRRTNGKRTLLGPIGAPV